MLRLFEIGGGNETPSDSAKKRVDYVDLLKGITILWIIWVHTDCYDFGSYRNPIFFFASGIFFKITDYKTFFQKRIKTILIPFLFFYLASIPFRYIVDLWDYRSFTAFDWSRVWDLFLVEARSDYMSINVPLWFLLTLFVIQALSTTLFKCGKWVVAVTALLAFVFQKALLAWPTLFMFNNALYWYGFFAVGYLIGKPLIRYMQGAKEKAQVMAVSLAVIFALIAIESIGIPTGAKQLADLKYIAFSVCFMSFWAFFNGNRQLEFLRFFGKNSLLVLGAHFWILVPLARISYMLTRVHHPLLGLVLSVLTAILLIPVMNWMNKKIPYLVGK